MDFASFLRGLGLEQYEQAFRDNAIDVEVLPDLTDADLAALGVLLGHRKKVLKAIATIYPRAMGKPEAIPLASSLIPRMSEAERRQLTVLFCDLVGSTELAARLDPEDLREVMRSYQAACAGVIARFEGHVARFLGDGVLAYFGWPKAHEDDAERAARAGLAMAEEMGRQLVGTEVRLATRVGIATGQVVVGDLISQHASDKGSVIGETPNLAERLQALAEPSTVVINQATRRLVGGLFDLAALGPRRLKGFAEPVLALRVLGESRAHSRFEALHGARLTPLVGRKRELALLFDRWQVAKEGEGQVVLLSGEAGIGKSRLVRALRDGLGAEPRTSLRYQCSPHHARSALWPVIEQLERAAGITWDGPPEANLDRLEWLLGQAVGQVGTTAPLIADLLGLPAAGRYPRPTSPRSGARR